MIDMRQQTNSFENLITRRVRTGRLRRFVAMLSAFVLLTTMNTLKLNADTLERIATCGIAQHVHDESCYDADGELACGLEEHVHTDACYQQRPTAEDKASTRIDGYVPLDAQVRLASPVEFISEDEDTAVEISDVDDAVDEVMAELQNGDADDRGDEDDIDLLFTPDDEEALPVSGEDATEIDDTIFEVEGEEEIAAEDESEAEAEMIDGTIEDEVAEDATIEDAIIGDEGVEDESIEIGTTDEENTKYTYELGDSREVLLSTVLEALGIQLDQIDSASAARSDEAVLSVALNEDGDYVITALEGFEKGEIVVVGMESETVAAYIIAITAAKAEEETEVGEADKAEEAPEIKTEGEVTEEKKDAEETVEEETEKTEENAEEQTEVEEIKDEDGAEEVQESDEESEAAEVAIVENDNVTIVPVGDNSLSGNLEIVYNENVNKQSVVDRLDAILSGAYQPGMMSTSSAAMSGLALAGASAGNETAGQYSDYAVFDISLLDDGVQRSETGEVGVVVRPENVNIYDNLPGNATATNVEYTLYHIHNSAADTLPVSVDCGEDGSLLAVDFTTDSFSYFVLKYTVDFEYTDPETGETYTFSMPGDGMLLLSELMEQLHFEESVADVEDVTFTDYNLLRIEEIRANTTYMALFDRIFGGEVSDDDATLEGSDDFIDPVIMAGDWAIVSLASFETEETLTIFFRDGSTARINVTDPPGSNSSGVWELTTSEGPEGTAKELHADVSSAITSTPQEKNVSFSINMSYELENRVLREMQAYTDGYPTLTYDLTDWLADAPVDIDASSGKIRQGNNTVGNYSIGADGKVTLTITNLFWLRQQKSLKGTFVINVTVDEEKLGDDDSWNLQMPHTDEVFPITFKQPDYKTTKTVSYNGQPNYSGNGVFITPETIDGEEYYILNYTVTMTNPSDKDYLTFQDTITGNQQFYGDVTVKGPDGSTVKTYTPSAGNQSISFNIYSQDNNKDAKKGTYTATYKTRIRKSDVRPYYDPANPDAEPTWEGNSANWKVNGGSDIPVPTTSVQPVNPTPSPEPTPRPGEPNVDKVVGNSGYGNGSENLPKQNTEQQLYYEVSFGEAATENNEATNMKGAVIRDSMTDNQKLVPDSVEISYDGGSTWVAMPTANGQYDGGVKYDFSARNESYTYSNNDTEVFRYKLPDTATAPVKVRYRTTIISNEEAIRSNLWVNQEVRNRAEFGNKSDMTSVPVDFPNEPTVEKKANNKTGDIGTVNKADTITYTITYGNNEVPLKGHTISDQMTALQNLTGNVVIHFDNNQHSDVTISGSDLKWNSNNFEPGTDMRDVFSYTFGDEYAKITGPITITYTTKVISQEQIEALGLYGSKDVNNTVTVDNKNKTTTGHLPTQTPSTVTKTVKDASGNVISSAKPGDIITYTVTYDDEVIAGRKLYDEMTDFGKVVSSITITSANGQTQTVSAADSHLTDENYSTSDTYKVLDGWVVPNDWTDPITVTYNVQMPDKDAMNELGVWETQHTRNHAWTDKNGDKYTDTPTDYGHEPEPSIEKVATAADGSALPNPAQPETIIKWVVTYGDVTTRLNGKTLTDSMVYLQELLYDDTYKVILYNGAEGSQVLVDFNESNGLTYFDNWNVSQQNYSASDEVQLFQYTVPADGPSIKGPLTLVYYTKVISQDEAWEKDIDGIKDVYNRALIDRVEKKVDVPTDFGDKPRPTKTAFTGTASDINDNTTLHDDNTAYSLSTTETAQYVTYEMTYPVTSSLANMWTEDYMTETQELVSDVYYKLGDGEWKKMPVVSSESADKTNVAKGEGVYWHNLHTDGSFSKTEKCVFAYRLPADTGNGPITFRYTVKMMTNEQALAHGLAGQVPVNNTFKIDNQQADHHGYVEPEIPEPTKTVKAEGMAEAGSTHTDATVGSGDSAGTQLDYTLTYGADGQWMNNPANPATIYDKMTNLQNMVLESGKPVVTVTYYKDSDKTQEATFTMPVGQNGVRWTKPSRYSEDMVDVFNYTFPAPTEKVDPNNQSSDTWGNMYGPVTITYSTTIISENEAKNSQVYGDKDVDNSFLDVANTTGTVNFPDNFGHNGKATKTGHFVDGEPYFGDDRADFNDQTGESKYETGTVRDEDTVYWSIKVDLAPDQGQESAFPLENVLVWEEEFTTITINGVQKGNGALSGYNNGQNPDAFIDYTEAVVTTVSGEELTPGVDYMACAGDGQPHADMGNNTLANGKVYWYFPQITEPVIITFPARFPATFAGNVEIENRVFCKVDNKQSSDSKDKIKEHYEDVVVNKKGVKSDDNRSITWTIILNPSAETVTDKDGDNWLPLYLEDTLPEGQKLTVLGTEDGHDYYIKVTHKTSLENGGGVEWSSHGATELLIGKDVVITKEDTNSYTESSFGGDKYHTQALTSTTEDYSSDFKADVSMYELSGSSLTRKGLSQNCYVITYKTTFTEEGWAALTSSEDGKETYDNAAFFKEGNQSWSGEGSETIEVENPLEKFELADDDKQVGEQTVAVAGEKLTEGAELDTPFYWYRIKVNPERVQLTKDGQTAMRMSDYIDSSLDIIQNSAKVYLVPAGQEANEDNWQIVSFGEEENDPVIRYNDDARMLVVDNLADKTYYIVEYRVKLRAADGNAYSVTNTVNLEAGKTWSDSITSSHVVQKDDATMSGSLSMTKVDENNITKLLPGAQFLLYRQPTKTAGRLVGNSWIPDYEVTTEDGNTETGNPKSIRTDKDGSYDGEPVFLGKFTSDVNGIVHLNEPDADSGDYGTVSNELGENGEFSPYVLYYWVEIEPPEGYLPNPDPHYVVLYDGSSAESNNVAWYLNLLWEDWNKITVATMSAGTDWIVTNSNTRSIGVTKRWDNESDFENQYKTRPDKIKVNLIQTDEDGNRVVYDTTTLSVNKDGVWDKYTNYLWTNLPATYEKEDGDTGYYTYTVEEVDVKGYIASYVDNRPDPQASGTVTIWNTLVPTKTDFNLEKLWVDGDGNEITDNLPASITVTLMKVVTDLDGHVANPVPASDIPGYVATVTPKKVTTESGEKTVWQYTWKDLPTKGADGTYTYTVVEDVPEGWKVTYSDNGRGTLLEPLTVTNTAVGTLNVTKTITGMSADKQSQLTEAEKKAIKFTLWHVVEGKADEKVATFTYNDMQNGVKSFTDLPVGTYKVTEEVVAPALEKLQGFNWKSVTFTVGSESTTAESMTGDSLPASPDATVTKNGTTYINTVNDYEYATGDLTITKAVTGGVESKTYKLKLQDSDGNFWVPGEAEGDDARMVVQDPEESAEAFEARQWVTFTNNDSKTWKNIPVGTVTITEDEASATETGKIWTVSGTDNVTVESQKSTSATVTNDYQPDEVDIPVTKTFDMQKDVYGVDEPTTAQIEVGLFSRERKIANADHTKLAEPEAWSAEAWPEELDVYQADPFNAEGVRKVDTTTVAYDSTEEKWVSEGFTDLPTTHVITAEEAAAYESLTEGDIYEIEYKVVELHVMVGGEDQIREYQQTVEGGDITNEYKPTTTNLTVNKTWTDGNGNHSNDTVTVKLYKYYGEKVNPNTLDITVNAGSFIDDVLGNAAAAPADGNSITVTVTGNGQTITQTLTNPDWTAAFTDLPAEKVNDDGYNYTPITYDVTYTVNGTAIKGSAVGATKDTTTKSGTLGTGVSTTTSYNLTSVVDYVPSSKPVNLTLNWTSDHSYEVPADAQVTVTIKDGDTVVAGPKSFKQSADDAFQMMDNKTYTVEYSWSGKGVTGGTDTTSLTVPAGSAAAPAIEATGNVSLIKVTVEVDPNWKKGNGTTTTAPTAGWMKVIIGGETVTLSAGDSWAAKEIYLPASGAPYTAGTPTWSGSADSETEPIGAVVQSGGTDIADNSIVTLRGEVLELNKILLSFVDSSNSKNTYLNQINEKDPNGVYAKANGQTLSWVSTSGANAGWFALNGASFSAEGAQVGTTYLFQIGDLDTTNWSAEGATIQGDGWVGTYVVFTAQEGTTEITITYSSTSASNAIASGYQLCSNDVRVPTGTLVLTHEKPFSIEDLFFGRAYADTSAPVYDKKTDAELHGKTAAISTDIGGQPVEVVLNNQTSGSAGYQTWSYSWSNLPTEEMHGGALRKVYYTVEETDSSNKTIKSVTYSYGSEDSEGRFYLVGIENEAESKGKISVTKTDVKDAETDETIETNNTFSFTIKEKGTENEPDILEVKKGQTDTSIELPLNKTYVIEERTTGRDIDGYVFTRVDMSKTEVTLTSSDTVAVTATNYYTKDKEDKTVPDSVTVNKQDDKNSPLPGATFTLYDTNTDDTLSGDVGTYTGSTFTISTEDSALASYLPTTNGGSVTLYLKETTAPTGYVLDDTIHNVVITTAIAGPVYDSTTKKWVTTTSYTMTIDGAETKVIPNTPKERTDETPASVTINKVNNEIKAINGATFKLYKTKDAENALSDQVGSGLTGGSFVISTDDTNIHALLEPLTNGHSLTLYLKETQAPTGYVAEDGFHTIVITKTVTGPTLDADAGEFVTTITYAMTIDGEEKATINVVNTPETIDIPVIKAWLNNDNGTSGWPTGIDSVTVTLYRGENPVDPAKTLELNSSNYNDGSAKFTGLPKYDYNESGEVTLITDYTVKETAINGYSSAVTGDATTGFTVTNTPKKTTLKVTKVWSDDNENHESNTIQIQLKKGGVAEGDPITLPQTDSGSKVWEYTWNDLEAIDPATGDAIAYTVEELGLTNGTIIANNGFTYTSTVNPRTGSIEAGYEYTINNTKGDTTSITVNKKWFKSTDSKNEIAWPEGVTVYVQLYKNDTAEGSPITLDAEHTSYTWRGLPKDNGTTDYQYTVTETKVTVQLVGDNDPVEISNFATLFGGTVAGTMADGYTVTNTVPKKTIEGDKTWNDETGKTHTAPELTLKRSSTKVAEQTVTATPVWNDDFTHYSYSDLDQYDPYGKEYAYTVTEAEMPGYVTTQEGYNLTNTAVTEISKSKAWADGNWPENTTVTFTLSAKKNGAPYDLTGKTDANGNALVLDKELASAEDSASWTNLIKYHEGVEIVYAVNETMVTIGENTFAGDELTKRWSQNDENGTITNTPVTIDIPVHKMWNGGTFQEGDYVKIGLYVGDMAVKKPNVTPEENYVLTIAYNATNNTWPTEAASFIGLPKYDNTGVAITYKVMEIEVKRGASLLTDPGIIKIVYGNDTEKTVESDGTIETVDIANTVESTKYKIKKNWVNVDEPHGVVPPDDAVVQVKLEAMVNVPPENPSESAVPTPTAIPGIAETVTLNGGKTGGNDTEEKKWEYEWSDLPKYSDTGLEIFYSAEEISYMIGNTEYISTLRQPDAGAEGYDIVFTNKLPDTDFEVTKAWVNGQKNTPPEGATITVTLYKKGAEENADIEVSSITLNGTADGTISDEDGTFTQASGETTGNAKAYEDSPWHAKWSGLPMYENDGTKIVYIAKETAAYTGYTASYAKLNKDSEEVEKDYALNGEKITNTEEEVQLSGSKTWIDSVAATGTGEHPNLTIKLYKVTEGTTSETESETEVTLSNVEGENYYFSWDKTDRDVWTYTIQHMPKKDAEDHIIKYRVREELPADVRNNYRANAAYSDGVVDGETGNITNADFVNTELTSLTVEKKWEMNGNPITATSEEWKDLPGDVLFHLWIKGAETKELKNDKNVAEENLSDNDPSLWKVEKSSSPTYSTTISGLEKYYLTTEKRTIDGEEKDFKVVKPYTYYITEVLPTGWSLKSILSGENVVNSDNGVQEGTITITNYKYSVSLPSTGGPGTTGLYVVGSILTLLALVLLITKKRTDGQGID